MDDGEVVDGGRHRGRRRSLCNRNVAGLSGRGEQGTDNVPGDQTESTCSKSRMAMRLEVDGGWRMEDGGG